MALADQRQADTADLRVTQTPPTSGVSVSEPARRELAPNPFKTFLIRNGVSMRLAGDFTPGTRERLSMGRAFRRDGLELDALAERAAEQGFIRDRMDTDELYSLIVKVASGERVGPMYGQDAEAEIAARVDRAREMEEDAESAVSDLADEELFVEAQILDDVPDLDAPSTASAEDAMRALGFTDREIRDAVAQQPSQSPAPRQSDGGADEVAGREAQGNRAGRDQEARADAEGLSAPTPADILAQQAQREAEERRKQDGGDKPAPVKSPTRDQIDLLNPQGGIFDAPAERSEASDAQPAEPDDPKRRLIDARKRVSILQSLRTCMGA